MKPTHRQIVAVLVATLAAATVVTATTVGVLGGAERAALVALHVAALVAALLAAWRWGSGASTAPPHLDTLTGLADRASFLEAAGRRLGTGTPRALIVLDLDHFKDVNDILGPEAGDRLLALVAERVRQAAPRGSLVGRLGGDEFAVLAAADPHRAADIARCLHERVSRPCELEGVPLDLRAGVGVACAPDHGRSITQLLQRSEIAMYIAKRHHRGATVYEPQRDQRTVRRLALMGETRRAVERGAFTLHYQPKVSLRTGRVTGVEALLRWPHPQRGLLPPREFLPFIERTGLMRRLSEWVLVEALAQAGRWRARGLEVPIAINLSARTLQDPALPARMAELLAAAGARPSDIAVEITESAIMTDPGLAREVLAELHAMGIALAIDDFGTGYSSLGYLKRLPVDILKIDASFVCNMTADESDAIIVRSTIELAHNLGLRVVAEGVESRETFELLRGMGCDQGQGFAILPPLPAEELETRLAAGAVLAVAAQRTA